MQNLKKISSLLLLVVFLAVTSGYSINTIICEMSGKTSYSLTKKTCCCKSKHEANNCCDNEAQSFDLEINTVETDANKETEDLFVLVPLHRFILELFIPERNHQDTQYARYSPPPLEKNIPVLIQSFLI